MDDIKLKNKKYDIDHKTRVRATSSNQVYGVIKSGDQPQLNDILNYVVDEKNNITLGKFIENVYHEKLLAEKRAKKFQEAFVFIRKELKEIKESVGM